MLPVSSQVAVQNSALLAATISPANNALVSSLFESTSFSTQVPAPGILALAEDPSQGFAPFQTARGTEVMFVNDPAILAEHFGDSMQHHWDNSLGAIVFRNQEVGNFGAVVLHGLMKNQWSELARQNDREWVWQALGGCMAFDNGQCQRIFGAEAHADAAIIGALETVLGKAMAMTPKWRVIDTSLTQTDHPLTTDLGGAKSVHLHGPSLDDKRASISVLAEVVQIIGAYIAGADQHMGYDYINNINWSNELGQLIPVNFMGASTVHEGYKGMDNPSPWTARGTYAGLTAARDHLLEGQTAPIFFQGFGGVGQVIVADAVADGHPIAGIHDVSIFALKAARQAYPKAPLFLDVGGLDDAAMAEASAVAKEYNFTLVDGLVDAMKYAEEARILSPNASAHPIDRDVAVYLANESNIKIVVGAANNMLGLVQGSQDWIAWYLQQNSIFVSNDSSTNRMGALSVTVNKIDLGEGSLRAQVARVGVDRNNEIFQAFLKGVPPQLWTDQQAMESWNELVRRGLAIGGVFPIIPLAPPSDEDVKKALGIKD